jgi:WD40 repeat protein
MIFDKSGALLIIGDPRGTIDIFELRAFRVVQQFKAHAGGLLGMRLLSFKEKFNIYTFGRDRGILVYDIKQGEAVAKFEKDSTSFSSMAVEEEGKLIIAAGFDGNLHVWDADKNKYLGSIHMGAVSLFSYIGHHMSRGV